MDIEYIYLVKLELKRKKEPFAPTTFWCSNKSYTNDELYPSSPHVFSGLQELSGFAQKMGEVLPVASSGGIILSNNRGTLASDKRWSDLLHYYAFYWQSVEVYLFTRPFDAQGDSSDLLLQFKGRINDTKISNSSNLFELGVTSDELSRAKPHYVIDSSTNPNAPEGSLGVPLPVVFGENVQVPAIRINDAHSTAEFAYATNIDQFENKTFRRLFVKDGRRGTSKDEYIPINTADNFNIPFDFSLFNWDAISVSVRDSLDWQNFKEVATGELQISTNPTPSFYLGGSGLSWGGTAYLHDSNSGTREGYLIVRLYEGIAGNVIAPAEQIDEVRIPMTDFVSMGINIGFPTSDKGVLHKADFQWSRLHVIRAGLYYWLSYGLNSPESYSTQNMQPVLIGASAQGTNRQRGAGTDPNSDWENLTLPSLPGSTRLAVEAKGCFYSANLTGLSLNNKGLGGSIFTITKPNSSINDIRDTEFIVEMDGLKDDTSGTITGIPNELITNPRDAVKLLYYKQNNNSLSGFGFIRSESSVNSALFSSVIKGATTSETTYRSLIADILFCFASKLYPSNSGGYNLWSYGTDISEDWEISEADCVLTDIITIGKGSIINSVTLNYDRRGIPLTNQDLQRDRDLRNYRKSQLFEFGTSPTGNIAFGSEALYTKEELSSLSENIDWIASDSNAQRLARYFLSTKTEELLIISIAVPALKYNFKNIKLGDIIRLSHIDLPYEYGTAADGVEKLPSYNGKTNESFLFGEPWRRCADILTRVIAKAPEITFNQQEPMIQLLLEQISIKESKRPFG